MLAMTLTIFPFAAPAQAAESGKQSLSMFAAGDDPASSWRYLYVTAENLGGRKVTLQVSSDGTWKNVHTQAITEPVSEQFGVEHQLTAAGAYMYRAVLLSGSTVLLTSNTVSATYTPPPPPAEMDISVQGNTVKVNVRNGQGLLVKLYRVDQGRQLLWSADKPAAAGSYTLSIPVAVSKASIVSVQAIGFTGTAETAQSWRYSFWATPPEKLGFSTQTQAYDAKKTFVFTGDIPAGSTVALQRLTANAWTTVWTSAPMLSGQKNPTGAYTFPGEAKMSFRAVQISAGKVTATTPAQSVIFAKLASELRSATWGGMFQEAEGRIAANTTASHTYFLDRALSDRTGYFQEYKGGKWVTLNTLTFKKSSGYPNARGVTVKTPLTSATVTRKYRVTLPATAREKEWTSKTATIEHLNPLHYTGYKKTAYNYMKKYCPNQVITLRGGATSYAYTPSYRIEMAQGMSGKSLQYVALHECAHIREFKLYKGDYAGLNKRMNTIFGGTGSLGMERAADCMSYVMGADRAYGGSYQRNCTTAQTAAARKILAGTKP